MKIFIPFLRKAACIAVFVMLADTSVAKPLSYELDRARSKVGFVYSLLDAPSRGTMQVKSATIKIDLDRLSNSSAVVAVDVTRAKAGLILATQALKSEQVLNAKSFPSIQFKSTRIRLNGSGRLSDGAEIDGILTVRGISEKITLRADLYREAGTAVDDLDKLSFRLRGSVDRHRFQASGYRDLVGPRIEIDILAYVSRAN